MKKLFLITFLFLLIAGVASASFGVQKFYKVGPVKVISFLTSAGEAVATYWRTPYGTMWTETYETDSRWTEPYNTEVL